MATHAMLRSYQPRFKLSATPLLHVGIPFSVACTLISVFIHKGNNMKIYKKKLILISYLLLLFIIFPSFVFAESYVTSYVDSGGDQWHVFAQDKAGVIFDIKKPMETSNGITIYKNVIGNQKNPNTKTKYKILQALRGQYELDTSIHINLGLGELWDESNKIWRKDCSFYEWACGSALIGFDDQDRLDVYKEIIWDIVTSKKHPFLLNHTFYQTDEGDSGVASSMPVALYQGIDNLHNILLEEGGKEFLKYADIIKKVFDIASEKSIDSKITQYISQNKLKLDEDTLESLDDMLDLIEAVRILGSGSLSFTKNLFLLEIINSNSIAKNRIETLKKAYNYVKNSEDIDEQLLFAIEEVENELITEYSGIKLAFIQAFKENANDILSFTTDLGLSRIGKKILTSTYISTKLSVKITPAQANAIMEAIDLGIAIGSTVHNAISAWQRIHLDSMISYVLNSYNQSTGPIQGPPFTNELIENPVFNALYDMLAATNMDYIEQALALLDSEVPSLIGDALEATCNTITNPQLYAVYFSTTAYNFGAEIGKVLQKWVNDEAFEDILEEYESIKNSAIQKGTALTEYSLLIDIDEPDDIQLAYEIENGYTEASLTAKHDFGNLTDVDFFKFLIVTESDIEIRLEKPNVNTQIQLLDSYGNIIGSDNNYDNSEKLIITHQLPGTYYIKVIGNVENKDDYGNYILYLNTNDNLSFLNLISPPPGSNYEIGDSLNVEWEFSKYLEGYIKIEISRNGGSSWSTIIDSTINDGSYDWPVEGPISNNCLIRVSSTANTSISDISDGAFIINEYCTGHDLSIIDMEISDSVIEPNDNVSSNIYIHNKSVDSEYNIEVVLTVKGPGYSDSQTDVLPYLGAGSTSNPPLTIEWSPGEGDWDSVSQDGNYILKATVLSASQCDEDMSDNSTTRSVFVSASGDPPIHHAFEISMYSLLEGETEPINGHTYEFNSFDDNNDEVRLYVDGERYDLNRDEGEFTDDLQTIFWIGRILHSNPVEIHIFIGTPDDRKELNPYQVTVFEGQDAVFVNVQGGGIAVNS